MNTTGKGHHYKNDAWEQTDKLQLTFLGNISRQKIGDPHPSCKEDFRGT